ncbi:hypothetical protein GOZ96_22805 [Agrobacterium vitis]|uniref:Uncharacterized protein n=1 Tax=Agrobacterium vitis TaxID=373 RepID=A0A7J4X2Q6_AGRVI|nr:hypothetical protein [Agrobacterium vitis]KAA3526093.1 hypothetical protein DXT89_16335 [Agrobacterium vitis]MUZ99400.1 hypothetical protein [Agrobacterium vitis]
MQLIAEYLVVGPAKVIAGLLVLLIEFGALALPISIGYYAGRFVAWNWGRFLGWVIGLVVCAWLLVVMLEAMHWMAFDLLETVKFSLVSLH